MILKAINNKLFLGALLAFIGTFILFPPYFDMGLYPVQVSEFSWASLDPSWVITLNYANLKQLVWGNDIVFTYGPLSYLSTRVGWGVNKIDFIIYDLFISFNFFYIFFKGFVKSQNKKLTTLLILSIGFIIPFYFGSGTALILFAFLLFWIRESLENNNYINYIFQITLLVLMFFIKLNTGLISFVLIFVVFIYQWIFNKPSRKILIAFLIILPTLLIIFSSLLHVAIANYIISGLNLISGFNEIMYLDLDLKNELFFVCLFIALSVIILLPKVYRENKIQYKGLVLLFTFSLTIYVLYKQAFVRADMGHIVEFFTYSLLILFCFREFHIEKMNFNSKAIVLVLIFISFFVTKRREDNLFNFKQKLQKGEYLTGMSNFTQTSGVHLFPNSNGIPQNIIGKIGQETVDIFPWNISLLFENKLNYSPRPVIQSYTAYTPYLEDLNFAHYNDKIKAPKYVLYQNESIDNRYPIFDEPKVTIALLNNYKCVDTFSINKKPILLLEKKNDFKSITFKKVKEYETDIKTPIIPIENTLIEVEASSSLLGNFQSLLTHTPDLFIMINTSDGKGNGFKTSKKLLKSGLISNYFVNTTADFKYYSNKENLNPIQEVKSYVVWPLKDKFYTSKIKVTEYKIIK